MLGNVQRGVRRDWQGPHHKGLWFYLEALEFLPGESLMAYMRVSDRVSFAFQEHPVLDVL